LRGWRPILTAFHHRRWPEHNEGLTALTEQRYAHGQCFFAKLKEHLRHPLCPEHGYHLLQQAIGGDKAKESATCTEDKEFVHTTEVNRTQFTFINTPAWTTVVLKTSYPSKKVEWKVTRANAERDVLIARSTSCRHTVRMLCDPLEQHVARSTQHKLSTQTLTLSGSPSTSKSAPEKTNGK
jgi:hypothetical protein